VYAGIFFTTLTAQSQSKKAKGFRNLHCIRMFSSVESTGARCKIAAWMVVKNKTKWQVAKRQSKLGSKWHNQF
jgi:hypothetical protein